MNSQRSLIDKDVYVFIGREIYNVTVTLMIFSGQSDSAIVQLFISPFLDPVAIVMAVWFLSVLVIHLNSSIK